MAELENFLNSQHIEGEWNSISDWLTFEGDERHEKEKLENVQLGKEKIVTHLVVYDCPSNDEFSFHLFTLFS